MTRETEISADLQVWEQQPGEPNTAYDHFIKYYLTDHDGGRSYEKAYNLYREERGKPPVDVLPGNWKLWAACVNRRGKHTGGFTWRERFEAYKQYQGQLRKEELHRKIFEEAQLWAEMQQEALRKEREMGHKLYERIDQMMSSPVFTRTSRVGDNGETIVIINAAGWKEGDIPASARLASDLLRRGLLMPTNGNIPQENWKNVLRAMDLDPDDPGTWDALLTAIPDDGDAAIPGSPDTDE